MIRPIITFAALAWAYCAKFHVHRFFVVQNKCLRQAVKAPRYILTKYLYSELKQELLQDVFHKRQRSFTTRATHIITRKLLPSGTTTQWKPSAINGQSRF
ncbi:hypothetical protein PR048_001854 [Dryococelus australis]|uniref:Secreted protein n=1 Tax=Dryococelus australis TaxID=614101 RepID=A0ABQ9III2_9NEOP|nr:hypothetical protein PR048_001854 [Dryococelus australis]